jgi:hypothetical protein
MKSNSIDVHTKNLDVELMGKNGVRMRWKEPHNCTIEVMDSSGEWCEIKYVQSIHISAGVDDPLPKVHIDYVVIP